MRREVETKRVPLGGHALRQRPLLNLGETDRSDRHLSGTAEQSVLTGRALLRSAGRVRKNGFGRSENRCAIRRNGVERARGGKTFDLPAVRSRGSMRSAKSSSDLNGPLASRS